MYAGTYFDFEHDGKQFRAYVELDDCNDAPWDSSEGHGIVSDWTRRDKKPGELILCEDRGSRRFYNFAQTIIKARADGWGVGESEVQALTQKLARTPTKGEIIERAVQLDYEYLRAWCNDEWQYIGVCVCLLDGEGEPVGNKYDAAIWGIESDADDYIRETARELTGDALREAKRVLQNTIYRLESSGYLVESIRSV